MSAGFRMIKRSLLVLLFLFLFLGFFFGLKPFLLIQERDRAAHHDRQLFRSLFRSFDNEPWNEPLEWDRRKIYFAVSSETFHAWMPGFDLLDGTVSVPSQDITGWAVSQTLKTRNGTAELWVSADKSGRLSGIEIRNSNDFFLTLNFVRIWIQMNLLGQSLEIFSHPAVSGNPELKVLNQAVRDNFKFLIDNREVLLEKAKPLFIREKILNG